MMLIQWQETNWQQWNLAKRTSISKVAHQSCVSSSATSGLNVHSAGLFDFFLSLRGLPVNHYVGTGGEAWMTAALLFGHCDLAEDLEAVKNPTLGDRRTLARKSRLGVELSNTPHGSTASRDGGKLEPEPVLWC